MKRALRLHNCGWWQQQAEEERRAHEPERQADFRQPYRIRPCGKWEWEVGYVKRNRKKLIRLWEERGLNTDEMLRAHGLKPKR